MYDNALRCIESDYPELLALAVAIGAISIENGKVVAAPDVLWDYIGYKLVNGVPLEDGNGNKYIHVNTRTTFSVGERAASLAVSNPELAGALANVGRFFVTDEFGQTKMPEVPMRCFA